MGGQQASRTTSGVTASEQGALSAAAAKREQIGIAISDEDGNVDDEAEIPDDTSPGTYRILVEGPNPRGGLNTVTIPIKVAAQVDNDGSSDDAGDTPTNATGTVTQASPVPQSGGGAALPQTGSNSLQKTFGLGVLALVLGAALMLARRVAANEPAIATAAPMRRSPPVRLVFDLPEELRSEVQRLFARRTDRHDPDRYTDL